MLRMRFRRADKLLRLTAGLGLLLMLAAEEKVCPWLLAPPVDADAPGSTTPADATDNSSQDADPNPEPLSWVGCLPDAAPPARVASLARMWIIEQGMDRHAGVIACGPVRPPRTHTLPAYLLVDTRGCPTRPPLSLDEFARTAVSLPRSANPAMGTAITIHAPPMS